MTKEEQKQKFENDRKHVLTAPKDCQCDLCAPKRKMAQLRARPQAVDEA